MKAKSKKNMDGIKAAQDLYGSINSIEHSQDYLDDYCPNCTRIESPKSLHPVQHGYKALFKCSVCAETWSCYYAKEYAELDV